MIYFPRLLSDDLTNVSSAGKVRIIFGARQVGKSTIIRNLATQNSLFINLQERRTRLDLEREPAMLTRQLLALSTHDITVLIDEIQKVPALLDEIQFIYDEHSDRFHFVLTGSSARKLKSTSSNLLPGRSHLFRLCPLILPERGNVTSSMILPVKHFESRGKTFPPCPIDQMVLYGNLPGISLEDENSRKRTLESYVELYLEEEIRREALVRDMGHFQEFLQLAASDSGNPVNLSVLSRESGIPLTTLKSYYQVLEDTFVGYRVPAYGTRSRKRILKTPKFLFFDTGVRNAAARLACSNDLLATQAGQLFENWVGLELIHRCFYLGRSYRVSFWRTAHHAEVDYVLETPHEVIPIEVKWTERPHERDARHLKLFMSTYPDKAKRGYVVCRCSAPQQISDNIQAIPWSML